MQRSGGQILPRGPELIRKLCGLLVALLPPSLVPGLLVTVDQQHVSHAFLSIPNVAANLALTPGPSPKKGSQGTS